MTVIPFKKRPEVPQNQPLLNIPPLTLAALAAMLGVHIIFALLPPDLASPLFYSLAFVPERLLTDPLAPTTLLSLVSHMFLHGSWLHMGMNGMMLLAFGAASERIYGPRRTAILFVLSGLAGAAAHMAIDPMSKNPMIGASGALSGLFAAVILNLMATGQMPAGRFGSWGIAALWIGISVVTALLGNIAGIGIVAWAAHAGGFLAGIFIPRTRLFKI